MHTDAIPREQVAVSIFAYGFVIVGANPISVSADAAMAAIDHRRVGPTDKASKAGCGRVRLQSIISVEERDISAAGPVKAQITSARQAAIVLAEQGRFGKLCDDRCRADGRAIVNYDDLVRLTLLSKYAR